MVVDREERGGPGWLRRDVGLAPVDLPAAAEQVGAYPYGLGPPLVADLRGEAGPFGDGRGRGDHQLAALAHERGRLPADQDLQHLQAREVEVEAAEVLGRLGDDRGAAAEAACIGIPGQLEVVVDDVVAAVAQLREVGIADSRSEEHTSELQTLMRNSYAVF